MFGLKVLIISILSVSGYASNFQAAQYNQMLDMGNSIMNKPGSIDPNVISGNCEFESGSCNGAEVHIYEGEKAVFSSTLLSNGYFKTPILPKNKIFKLVLSWKKYKFNEIRDVKTGESIVIKLARP
jgi:hypothetical protein